VFDEGFPAKNHVCDDITIVGVVREGKHAVEGNGIPSN
jgi:hypothetical protein